MSQVVFLTVEPSKSPVCVDRVPQTHPAWIHPHLIESNDPVKGRQFRVSALVPKGTCLLVDRPYAVIPVVDDPAINANLICSNPACNRRASRLTERLRCPNSCIPDVIWCSGACRDLDSVRHDFECSWLKRFSKSIRTKRSEYEFGMLWVIVRLLATRHREVNNLAPTEESQLGSHQWKFGWEGVSLLCGSPDTWPHERVRAWSSLVKKYLQSSPILPHGLSTERVLHLICQEEANSFGLYPRETGVFPIPKSWPDRGEQFAAAVYPTAAMANHSCSPNIIHKSDDHGCMVFTAARDIQSGEECCITYFDLTQHNDITSRRQHLQRSFRFLCRCERCVSEDIPDQASQWTPMPMIDIE